MDPVTNSPSELNDLGRYPTTIFTKVVDVQSHNRQRAIRSLYLGESLLLIPEPLQSLFPRVIKFVRRSGDVVGSLERGLTIDLSWMLFASKCSLQANVERIVGDRGKSRSLEVIIRISLLTFDEAISISDALYPPM